MTETARRPLSAEDRPVAPDTVAAAEREATRHARASELAMVDVLDGPLEGDVAAIARISLAQASASLAVAAELRALRLSLTQQLGAMRHQR